MVKNIKVVIGANFGDEGKGLMTDYFCRQAGEDIIVILHNGGAQRGHTVKTTSFKHIFHHFGSGTFQNAITYLTRDFILNPIAFKQEWDELDELGYEPYVLVSSECMVTTPFDMILNQIIEESRGYKRHGSCGMGIYETIHRYEKRDDKRVKDLKRLNASEVMEWVKDVKTYFYERLREMDIEAPLKWNGIIEDPGLLTNFSKDLAFLLLHTIQVCPNEESEFLSTFSNIIFENGQGLLLDQNNKEYFPYLTPSNTGLENPAKIIKGVCLDDCSNVEVCYVTRSYMTRHGAGPLPDECSRICAVGDKIDLTNVPNPHQGELRYGSLDLNDLIARINMDFHKFDLPGAKLSLAITHEDEREIGDIDFTGFNTVYKSLSPYSRLVKRLDSSIGGVWAAGQYKKG